MSHPQWSSVRIVLVVQSERFVRAFTHSYESRCVSL
jgi:hypothetical protein